MSYVYTHVHTSTIFLELTFFFVAVFHKEWFERNEFTKSEASNRKVVPLLESIYFSLCVTCCALRVPPLIASIEVTVPTQLFYQNATANTNWPGLLRILSRTTVLEQ